MVVLKDQVSLSLPDIETEDLNPVLGFAMAEKLLHQQLRLENKPELSHDDMRTYINKNFSEYKWSEAKMEKPMQYTKWWFKITNLYPYTRFYKVIFYTTDKCQRYVIMAFHRFR